MEPGQEFVGEVQGFVEGGDAAAEGTAGAVGPGESVGGLAGEGEEAFVEVAVAAGADGEQVGRERGAAFAVEDDVVDLQPEDVGAAGDGALVAVSAQDLAALGGGDEAGLFVEIETGVFPVGHTCGDGQLEVGLVGAGLFLGGDGGPGASGASSSSSSGSSWAARRASRSRWISA